MDAYRRLCSAEGPRRFAQVAPHLYRGGEPTLAHLTLLARLGVRTAIDLRDTPSTVAIERTCVESLGMIHRCFAFSGRSDPAPDLLRAIVAVLQNPGGHGVYCIAASAATALHW